MIEPMSGYVLATIETKQLAGGLILSKEAVEDNEEFRQVIVQAVANDVEGIEKGDNIIISPDAQAMGVKDTDGEEYLLVKQEGICAKRS